MKKNKSEFKRNRTTPSRNALCIRLAAGDHLAGMFLVGIVHWARYGRAEIPGVEGEWVANPRSWWMRECGLSSSQYNRSISKLKELGLVEARQWWFGRKNILYLRPTKAVLDYITSAATWVAADQFLPEHLFEIDNPKLSNSTISNEVGVDEKPGTPKSSISNNISNCPNNQTSNPQGAVPASPSCANKKIKQAKKKFFGKNKEIQPDGSIANLRKLELFWISKTPQTAAGVPTSKLSATERRALALLESYFSELAEDKLNIADGHYQASVKQFINWILDHWSTVDAENLPLEPSLSFLAKDAGPFMNAWLVATFGKGIVAEMMGHQI